MQPLPVSLAVVTRVRAQQQDGGDVTPEPGAENATASTTPKLTGDPQKDYLFDPNLPRELNGYDLSDYPFYGRVPKNMSFKCDGRHDGFYASKVHKCQARVAPYSFMREEEDPNNEVPTNMIVLYRGYLYSVQVADLDAGEIMTPHDMEAAMNWIIADARGRLPTIGPSVAALTCDERDAWAENRERLKALSPANAAILHEIESSLFGWSLQEDKPETESDVLKKLICDGIRDRWADKSFTCMLFKNGCTGNSSDHTPIDAMVNSTIALYVTLSFRALGGEWPAERVSRTIWPDPRRLDFVIDEKLETDIARILRGSQALSSTINCKLSHFREFGKGVLKVYGTHPDAFVQAAIQLTYHRMHGKPGSAYETATTRQFYHGRTETCRTCTLETVDFAKAMDDVDTEVCIC
ncbi:unnamed protein product [Notodromas monacha]|uniref:Choline/carnitine acyltransferase domain-containing protein n=1 Tax=Notodromas monacha TaxID=399045 RepID=A0A7R9GIY1_9CRUS|nr:unnamed protein product [Notodromas monacha]CAG0922940.1 unnamed protein product [Notodromas monacha]